MDEFGAVNNIFFAACAMTALDILSFPFYFTALFSGIRTYVVCTETALSLKASYMRPYPQLPPVGTPGEGTAYKHNSMWRLTNTDINYLWFLHGVGACIDLLCIVPAAVFTVFSPSLWLSAVLDTQDLIKAKYPASEVLDEPVHLR